MRELGGSAPPPTIPLESEPGLLSAGPMLLSTIKDDTICIFLISQFITVMSVLKFHIMILDLWISTDSWDYSFICAMMLVRKHI